MAHLDDLNELHTLRSVDNLYLTLADVDFDWNENNTKELITVKLDQLSAQIDWNFVAKVWSRNQPFIRLRGANNKRRGQKKLVKSQNEDVEKKKDRKRKDNPDFSMASFSLPVEDSTPKDIAGLEFRCSGMSGIMAAKFFVENRLFENPFS